MIEGEETVLQGQIRPHLRARILPRTVETGLGHDRESKVHLPIAAMEGFAHLDFA